MRYRRRNPLRKLTGGVFILVLAFAFLVGGSGHHDLFLPILFVGLAFATLIGSFFTLHPKGVYGGIQSFIWLMGLAFCFFIGFFPWILFVVAASIIVGVLARPIMAALLGLGILGAANLMNQRQQQYYQPPTQPYQPPSDAYQQGYQAAPPQGSYQEGGRQYPYPQECEQPQAHYPQEMPPQQ